MTDPVATARELAAAHPRAKLPCPVCVASVKAANLEGHLAKVHPGGRNDAALRGSDRRTALVALVAMVIATGAVIGIVAATGIAVRGPLALGLHAGVAGVLGGLALLGVLGRLPATLVHDGDRLALVYCLGLRRKAVRLPCALQVGGMYGMQFEATYGDNDGGKTIRVGSYARFGAITIGCKQALQLADHWADCGRGQRRRTCDIMVSRETLVALEYSLARAGYLRPIE